jgi:hypothetical protein
MSVADGNAPFGFEGALGVVGRLAHFMQMAWVLVRYYAAGSAVQFVVVRHAWRDDSFPTTKRFRALNHLRLKGQLFE